MNLEQLISTWKGPRLVLALFAGKYLLVNIQLQKFDTYQKKSENGKNTSFLMKTNSNKKMLRRYMET